MPVHFLLERGRVPGTAPQPGSATDLGKPATVAATVWLKVLPEDNRVEVKLTYPAKPRPGQKIEVPVDLTCRVPGEYSGPASRAYLYYNADLKHWVEPLKVNIAAKK